MSLQKPSTSVPNVLDWGDYHGKYITNDKKSGSNQKKNHTALQCIAFQC